VSNIENDIPISLSIAFGIFTKCIYVDHVKTFRKTVDNYNEIMEDDIVGENKDKETEIR